MGNFLQVKEYIKFRFIEIQRLKLLDSIMTLTFLDNFIKV